MIAATLLLLAAPRAPQSPLPEVRVASDDVEITTSCRVVFDAAAIHDDEGDGVLRVTADGVTVELAGELRGAAPRVAPDAYEGVGIVVTGDGVTLRGARVSGFRCAIRVTGAKDVVLERCDVSDNRRQRLRSTPAAEDGADWLWPHDNDRDEWLERYGAGIWAEDCAGLVVRRCRARDGQNGLCLVRTVDSQVYDNDFSFLSGWGVALWRSSRNMISRNALDFCVRGYSHGVYNRGQDSAGILVFEQCLDNVFVENSATHGGDGFFGFAGKEALGEAGDRGADGDHERRGCNGNVLWGNDLSCAAAHGIELTFSFDNVFAANRLVENAICGVWAGYARDTRIVSNELAGNGEGAYGAERGGVNAEHASGLAIVGNSFADNACGVRLWWDEDPHLADLPWTRANGAACSDNLISDNVFARDAVGIELVGCARSSVAGNSFRDVARELVREGGDEPVGGELGQIPMMTPPRAIGETRPVGARPELRGRQNILMTEWGPYDFEGMHARRVPSDDVLEHRWEILGGAGAARAGEVDGCMAEVWDQGGSKVLAFRSNRPGGVASYVAWVEQTSGERVELRGTIVATTTWDVTTFAWTVDLREDVEAWRAEAAGGGEGDGARAATFQVGELRLRYGVGGPKDVAPAGVGGLEEIGTDRFGTLARTTIELPAGRWAVRTVSDDGIRVWLDGDLVIDDWTWHAPKAIDAEVLLEGPREVVVRVEHFELDGVAELSVELEPVE